MTSVQSRFFDGLRSRPVIAGLRDAGKLEAAVRQGEEILGAGAIGVSTSAQALWGYRPDTTRGAR